MKYAKGADHPVLPPCLKLTAERDGLDGEAYMYKNCYDFCVEHCRWPQDDDNMHCWAEYYRRTSGDVVIICDPGEAGE